jgi:hypothetical protein
VLVKEPAINFIAPQGLSALFFAGLVVTLVVVIRFVSRIVNLFVANNIRTGRVGFHLFGVVRVDLGFGEKLEELDEKAPPDADPEQNPSE